MHLIATPERVIWWGINIPGRELIVRLKAIRKNVDVSAYLFKCVK